MTASLKQIAHSVETLAAAAEESSSSILEMAAAKEWGDAQYEKLDALTVSLSHPDSLTALLSKSGAITGHFASPPFSYQEKAKPPRHSILSSYDIPGGPATFNVVWATEKFREANPKVYAAFVAAFDGFNCERIAAYTEGDVDRLMHDDSILHSARKIRATISKSAPICRTKGTMRRSPDFPCASSTRSARARCSCPTRRAASGSPAAPAT